MSAAELPEKVRQTDQHAARFVLPAAGNNLKSAMATPERQIIVDALEANGWNRQNTAKMLGINRTTLYKKMKKYDIQYEKEKQLV